MSYRAIELSGMSSGQKGDDVLFSPFHTNFADMDEDDANFFDFTSNDNVARAEASSRAQDGKSSELATGFNFVNSIVGAGIIGIPVAIKECGLFMGIFLLVLVAYLVDQSVILLIECGVETKKTNFEDLCKHLLGSTGYNVCVVSMLLFAYGAMLAYFVIIGDTLPVAFDYFLGDGSAPSRNAVIVVAAIVPILPLSLMRNLSSLSYTSLLSISADVVLVLFIIMRGPAAAKEEDTQFNAEEDVTFIEYQLFEGIGTMSFAFVCQHNTFIVYNSMRNANLKRWKKVSHSSIFTSFVLCLVMGLGGFLAFGSYTEGDVLNNFPEKDRLILTGRLLLACTMVFTYPLECFVARHSLCSLLQLHGLIARPQPRHGTPSPSDHQLQLERQNTADTDCIDDIVLEMEEDGEEAAVQDGGSEGDSGLPRGQHILFTLVLWGSSLLLALVVSDLHLILALTGAVAASFLAYILPALIYLKTYDAHFIKAKAGFDPTSNHYQPKFLRRIGKLRRFVFPFFLLAFGLLSLIVGVGTVVFEVLE
mmetsp:Transcript_12505/g.20320  ORF Transcript_12505/g.20320 Transcript_12505/m.20320 type:complete len:534 (-) Transcript_12505:92-1693(-)|eukprot:CAMPEP_0114474010 /NCGR_PEP_ID=MMETSP0104-20121206/13316_1 /TAXON_ID=37642 ORGANISM="Paraphysomonas imperforata, Strain PA2" /NCGR_SAMPLE_ID=MMETSP0104 /ASSEMBLY_ACC=CAM_ASM_000202 /LENGTH=533 /DNA_ID=CAMNT_0001648291 /DNA_START=205 /DNA_END=1806 /DNA_ORIENTATION=+